jgi:ribulose-5-phosphate 4-epimerase/fuculose-1-phosphate aldolase
MLAPARTDNTTQAIRDQVSPEEWQVRIDLACAYRLVAHFGWDDLIFTHLSACVPGSDNHFLINPINLMFDEITASSLVKIDIEGNPVMPTPHIINPAGFTIHSAVHMARPDARFVLHLHTPYGQAVSAMKAGLMPLTQTALNVICDLSYHDYEGIALDLDERSRIVADLGDKNLMLLRNHGTMAVGVEIGDAFLRMYFLERACEAQVHALSGGIDSISEAPKDAKDNVMGQNAEIAKFVSRQLAWPALVRKAKRVDPSFED